MPAPVGRNPSRAASNGFAPKHSRREEEHEDQRERAGHVRHRARGCARDSRPDRDRRVQREDQRPEQQRARLPAPERREHVDLRQVRARVRRDVLEREVVREQRGPQTDRREHDHRERRVQRRARRSSTRSVAARARRRRTTPSPLQAAMSSATQSDSSPTRITPSVASPPCTRVSACTCRSGAFS